jgi:hypothetical protein
VTKVLSFSYNEQGIFPDNELFIEKKQKKFGVVINLSIFAVALNKQPGYSAPDSYREVSVLNGV